MNDDPHRVARPALLVTVEHGAPVDLDEVEATCRVVHAAYTLGPWCLVGDFERIVAAYRPGTDLAALTAVLDQVARPTWSTVIRAGAYTRGTIPGDPPVPPNLP